MTLLAARAKAARGRCVAYVLQHAVVQPVVVPGCWLKRAARVIHRARVNFGRPAHWRSYPRVCVWSGAHGAHWGGCRRRQLDDLFAVGECCDRREESADLFLYNGD